MEPAGPHRLPPHPHGETPVLQFGKGGVSHPLGQGLDDGQTQARVLAGAHLVRGIEALKDPGQVLRGQVRGVVGEGGDQLPCVGVQPDSQGGAAMLQGIADEVGEDAGDRPGSASTGGRQSSSSTVT